MTVLFQQTANHLIGHVKQSINKMNESIQRQSRSLRRARLWQWLSLDERCNLTSVACVICIHCILGRSAGFGTILKQRRPTGECHCEGGTVANSRVHNLAMALNPRKSPLLSMLPASQLRGLSGAESAGAIPLNAFKAQQIRPAAHTAARRLPDISATTAWHTDISVQAGVQAVLRISKQTSPVCKRDNSQLTCCNRHASQGRTTFQCTLG